MTATLTIELPDDFEKGSCYGCPFYQIDYDYATEYCELNRSPDNCPLEIQDDNYCPMNMECENCRGV